MAPFYGWVSAASRLHSHYKEGVYFLPISSQIFLGLIWSISERWKSESTLEPQRHSGSEHGTPGTIPTVHLENPAPINMAEPLIFIKSWQTDIWKNRQKQKPTLFLTKQCWSRRYKVSVLSVCGECHLEGFIVASFYRLKHS